MNATMATLVGQIISALTIILATFITQYFLYRSNITKNEQHAQEVKNALDIHQQDVATNFSKIDSSLAENTQISKDAFHEANNANMKIAAALKVETTSSDQADRIEAIANKLLKDKKH
jgi:hypothetical protein